MNDGYFLFPSMFFITFSLSAKSRSTGISCPQTFPFQPTPGLCNTTSARGKSVCTVYITHGIKSRNSLYVFTTVQGNSDHYRPSLEQPGLRLSQKPRKRQLVKIQLQLQAGIFKCTKTTSIFIPLIFPNLKVCSRDAY